MKNAGYLSCSLSLLALTISTVVADCSSVLTPQYAVSLASGWDGQLIVNDLSDPRGIIFDQAGNLLVVDSGTGIVQYQFDDGGGTCLGVARKTWLVNSTALNHGIALSNDGNTLYASSSNSVWSWAYNASAAILSSENQTLVTGMSNDDHTTRTLLLAQDGESLLVSRGSNSNIDAEALDITSGHSQIRIFNLTNATAGSPYNFDTDGRLLGWGLRNSVAVAQHPTTGGVFSAENSVDQITRDGTDIHEDNPGEEMNYHGFLNGTTTFSFSSTSASTSEIDQGSNYGYPSCFAAWSPSDIPDSDLQVGEQFVTSPNSTFNDTTCATSYIPPILTFQAHMAPLDLIFTPNGSAAYISFHGSWDRTDPVGYKVSTIAFDAGTGLPTESSTSNTAVVDVMTNTNNSVCPDECFRPVGLALDAQGRLFLSSDSTGELYVLQYNATAASGSGTGTATSSSISSGTITGATSTATKEGAAVERWRTAYSLSALWVAFITALILYSD